MTVGIAQTVRTTWNVLKRVSCQSIHVLNDNYIPIVIFAHVMIGRTLFLRTIQFVLTVRTIRIVITSVTKMKTSELSKLFRGLLTAEDVFFWLSFFWGHWGQRRFDVEFWGYKLGKSKAVLCMTNGSKVLIYLYRGLSYFFEVVSQSFRNDYKISRS